ncbi:MAG TPA: ribonuclease Y, partial [Candidatus Dojkabacteria bacterium]|nr:ribonuclease Y [Candidatus Dojkabacteria bacterium]
HIADAISGARPGARKESYESYIKRIQALEDLTMKIGKNKINEVFAIHAGREVRIIVKPEEISDEGSTLLAHKIAREIEKTQTYPGTIQVTVIRETRALDTAR